MAGQIVPENDCDNKDNDCNAVVDDAFPTRLKPCSRGLGACTTTGIQVCAPTHDSLVCNAAVPPSGGAETCNGIDDDCDGVVDNGAPDVWTAITVAGMPKQIYRYEASHPDATAASSGALTHRSCSASGRQPWVNVTYPEAVAACTAAGARICTEEEWQTACRATTPCTWSFATSCTTYQSGVCNDGNLDHDLAVPNIQNAIAVTGSLASCYSDWGGGERVFDMSGNVSEWALARAAGVNPLRGGAFNTPQGGATCNASFPVADDTFSFGDVGFRCCKD
jgi:hypothetical protein